MRGTMILGKPCCPNKDQFLKAAWGPASGKKRFRRPR